MQTLWQCVQKSRTFWSSWNFPAFHKHGSVCLHELGDCVNEARVQTAESAHCQPAASGVAPPELLTGLGREGLVRSRKVITLENRSLNSVCGVSWRKQDGQVRLVVTGSVEQG